MNIGVDPQMQSVVSGLMSIPDEKQRFAQIDQMKISEAAKSNIRNAVSE
jgi:hypothetical protein